MNTVYFLFKFNGHKHEEGQCQMGVLMLIEEEMDELGDWSSGMILA